MIAPRGWPARILVLVAGSVPAVSLAFTAFADPVQTGRPARWAGPTVDLLVQQDGVDDVTDGTAVVAVERAISSWNAHLQGLQLAPSPDSSRSAGNDGINRITFLESNWPAAGDAALAITVTVIENGNPSRITDADVLLNGTLGPWGTRGDSLQVDVQSVATHELGHLLGLWHTFDETASMFWSTRRGSTNQATLADDDQRGARFMSSDNASCTGDADCPLLVAQQGGTDVRLRCMGGACVQGAGTYGMECLNGGQCASGSCLAERSVGVDTAPGACTQACTGAASCMSEDACTTIAAQRYCAPGRGCFLDADCGGGANDKCILAFDGHHRCTRLCSRNANCPAGQRCVDFSYGAGVCLAPGPISTGSPCTHALECAGLACLGTQQRTCAVAPPKSPLDVIPDAGANVPDAATTPADASLPPDAAMPPPVDAGPVVPSDAGSPRDANPAALDAAPAQDAAVPAADASSAPPDGSSDAGAPSEPPTGGGDGSGCTCVETGAPSASITGLLALLFTHRFRRRAPAARTP